MLKLSHKSASPDLIASPSHISRKCKKMHMYNINCPIYVHHSYLTRNPLFGFSFPNQIKSHFFERPKKCHQIKHRTPSQTEKKENQKEKTLHTDSDSAPGAAASAMVAT